jgi:hypothetical protein
MLAKTGTVLPESNMLIVLGLYMERKMGLDPSPPSSAEVKNVWSYTSTPPIYFLDVGRDRFY